MFAPSCYWPDMYILHLGFPLQVQELIIIIIIILFKIHFTPQGACKEILTMMGLPTMATKILTFCGN